MKYTPKDAWTDEHQKYWRITKRQLFHLYSNLDSLEGKVNEKSMGMWNEMEAIVTSFSRPEGSTHTAGALQQHRGEISQGFNGNEINIEQLEATGGEQFKYL